MLLMLIFLQATRAFTLLFLLIFLSFFVIPKHPCFDRAPRAKLSARLEGSAKIAVRRATASMVPRVTMSAGGGRGHLSVENSRLALLMKLVSYFVLVPKMYKSI